MFCPASRSTVGTEGPTSQGARSLLADPLPSEQKSQYEWRLTSNTCNVFKIKSTIRKWFGAWESWSVPIQADNGNYTHIWMQRVLPPPVHRWRADSLRSGRHLTKCYSQGGCSPTQHTKKRENKVEKVRSREAVYTTIRLFDVFWWKQRSAGPCTAEFWVRRKLYTHSFVGLFYVVFGSLEYLESPH